MYKTVLALISTTFLLGACNTMEGAGQDMQAGGKKLERSADDHKNYNNDRY
jgi:entericidin B